LLPDKLFDWLITATNTTTATTNIALEQFLQGFADTVQLLYLITLNGNTTTKYEATRECQERERNK